jgi:hypothetical protein
MFSKILVQSSLAAVALASTLMAPVARAATITFTGSGTGSDGAVAASATFTTSAGLLTVTLTNTLSPTAVVGPGQALSDLSFVLSSNGGTLGTTTASGQQGTIGTGGVVTTTSGSPGRFIGVGGGTFSYTGGTTFLLEAIGGGTPSEMILPSASSYPNANGGLVNNFDPYTIGTATFTFALSGVTSTTTINSATFSFGTSPDTFTGGTPPPIPEPTSIALLGTGMAGLAAIVRRRVRILTA